MFETHGLGTIDSDSIGHSLLEPGGAAFDRVAEEWPGVLIDGVIDRGALAKIVFNSPDDLAALEGMTHPLIFGEITARAQRSEGPLIVEIPILRPTMWDEWQVMVVDAPDSVRLERGMRRGQTEEDLRARMAAQPTRGEWLAAADLVIPNPGAIEELEESVEAVAASLFGRG